MFGGSHPYGGRRDVAVDRWVVRGRARVAAHHVHGDDVAWFGAFDCADDPAVAAAVVDAVRAWALDRGATELRGPALFTPDDGDAGILVDGFEHPGGTARPWHPPWYAEHLAAAGLVPLDDALPRWRLPTPTGVLQTDGSDGRQHTSGLVPPHAGRLSDPALALAGPDGEVAAVPDVSAAARATSLRRPPAPEEAAVVRLDGEPGALVPLLLAVAASRGYRAVWCPWSPDRRPPDTVHRLFGDTVVNRNRPI